MVLLVALSLVVFLNRQGLVSLGWTQLVLNDIKPESGFAYVAKTGHSELSSHVWPSTAEVLENGRRLKGPPNAPHADIRGEGQGRYSFWHATVYFSPSDNSNPAGNGRTYAIYYPRQVWWPIAAILYIATLLATAGSLASWLKKAGSSKSGTGTGLPSRGVTDRPLALGMVLLLLAYLVSRFPFFRQDALVGFDSDSLIYLKIAHSIARGHQGTEFIYRTPFYPLFMRLVLAVSGHWLLVIIVQSACFLASLMSLLFAIHRLRKSLVIPAAVVLSGYMVSSDVLWYETSILADSLYASAVILSTACIILALVNSRRPAWFFAASVTMAGAILIRPVGMYFIVIYLLIGAYILWNRLPRKALLALLVPFPTLLLVFCTYNYYTIGTFSVSMIGRMALAAATALYIEPDPSLPAQINQVLRQVPAANRNAGVTDADILLLRSTWNPAALYPVFTKPFNFVLDPKKYGPLFGQIMAGDFVSHLRGLGEAEFLAIRRHPVYYLKFVETNVVVFFTSMGERRDFLEELANRVTEPGLPAWYAVNDDGRLISGRSEVRIWAGRDSFPARVHQSVQASQTYWFRNNLWLAGYVAAALFSLIQVWRSRGRHAGAFILLVIALVPIGASLTTCLVNISIPRYVFPTQFSCYLSVVLVPAALGLGTIREKQNDS